MSKITIISLLLLTLNCNAGEKEEMLKAMSDNSSSEYISCAAYFSLVSGAVARPEEPELSSKYKQMYEAAINIGLTLAKDTRTVKMATKVTLSRFEIYLSKMKKTIDNNYSNISLLFSKYSEHCKMALEQPEEFANLINKRIIKNLEKN